MLRERAIEIAKRWGSAEAELFGVLFEMKRRREFSRLRYRGVFEFCVMELKLSETQAHYFQKVVAKSEEVVSLRKVVLSGELSISKARRLVPVITKENAGEWIAKAAKMKQRDLEAAVAKENPRSRVHERLQVISKDVVEFVAAVTPDVAQKIEDGQDLESQRLKRAASFNETLDAALTIYLRRNDPLVKQRRVSSRKPPEPRREPIPVAIQREVHTRDGRRCTAIHPDGTRCTERRWLELDHIIEVRHGGLNIPSNLRTLCGFHHKVRHQQA